METHGLRFGGWFGRFCVTLSKFIIVTCPNSTIPYGSRKRTNSPALDHGNQGSTAKVGILFFQRTFLWAKQSLLKHAYDYDYCRLSISRFYFIQNQSRGLDAELSSAHCSIKGKNLPLKVMTTRFSPCFPVVVPTSQ